MLEKQECERLNDNKIVIKKWLNSHINDIVDQIEFETDTDNLLRLSAKLNMVRTLKHDIAEILTNKSNNLEQPKGI